VRDKVKKYSAGILVQTVGQMEDSFDFETIQETAEKQSENYSKMWKIMREMYPDMMGMGTGTCTRFKTCTYPAAPCRFPDELVSSMEACGLVVSEVCTANGVPYNHGKDTICYTGCFLLE
jgi:hypothetical protein